MPVAVVVMPCGVDRSMDRIMSRFSLSESSSSADAVLLLRLQSVATGINPKHIKEKAFLMTMERARSCPGVSNAGRAEPFCRMQLRAERAVISRAIARVDRW